jgi:presenilin-like A22 family membrane protease
VPDTSDIEPRGALATPQPDAPATKADLRRDGPAVLFLALLFVASIALSMAFAGTAAEFGLQAFGEDTDNLANPIIYLVIVIAFTGVILLIAKYGKRILIKYFVLGSVLVTIYYVAWPLLGVLLGNTPEFDAPEIIAAVISVALTVLLWFYPEWYVIDAVGVAVAAGAAGIFGISFGLLPSLLLLVAFAVYDAIAVYRTKHMLSLADSVLELRLPIMFVVPKTKGYSFLEETRRVREPDPNEKKEEREAMFMGLGDAVIPAILVVSSLTFLDPAVVVGGMGGNLVVALATLVGSFLGFLALMWFVLKGQPQAGLPLLNGGALVGFFAALLPLYGFAPLVPHF